MSLAPTHDSRPFHPMSTPRADRQRASASSSNRHMRDRVSSDAVMAAYINDLAKPEPWAPAAQESEVRRRLDRELLAA